jgi:outer membrane biosynthesis protein TonB
MDAETGQDRQALAAQLAEAQERLARLAGDLRRIDGELEELSTERRQHQLLRDACGALEELAQIGGASLFWGEPAVAGSTEQQILRARSLVDGFEKRIGEIEERRQEVLEAVLRQQDDADGIEDDVLDAEEEERRIQQEWIVEREMSEVPIRALVMPWSRRSDEDYRFRKSLLSALAVTLLLALVIPWIEIPIFEPDQAPIDVSDRVVKLMMKPKPLPERAPEPTPVVAEQKIQEPEKTVPEPAKPKEGVGKGKTEGPAEGPAKGLLAFKEQLAGVKVNPQLARLGADARVTNAGAASGPVSRSMITTNAPGSSGGINLAALSRGVNGGGSGGGSGSIQGVQIARATSNIAGGGGGSGAKGQGGHGAIAGRTDEEIQIVFDRHKSELYRLYNRELRRDPTLRGQMILHMTIQPNGSVSMCQLRASDMNAPELGAQVVGRVRGFDFGAKEGIGPVTILYPIDFLPAG